MDFLLNMVIGLFFFVLIICGFGVPIPEDITLVSGGVIAGLYPENVNSHLMLLVSMIGVLAGDSCMYWLGRIYGTKILRFRPIRRIVTLQRLRIVREKFSQYGNRVLFVARFFTRFTCSNLYGIRYYTPCKLCSFCFNRFLCCDYFCTYLDLSWGIGGLKNLDWLHTQIQKGQIVIYIFVGLLVLFFFWKWKKSKKINAIIE